ncbi:MAG TPA: hypothetical protein VGL71_09745 [Urbifossiella sp.]
MPAAAVPPSGTTPSGTSPDFAQRAGRAPETSRSDLYGETGGDSTLPAAAAPPSAPLRARNSDSFYRLSNPRIEPRRQTIPPPRPGAGPLLVIDYERTQERAIDGKLSIVIRTAGGKDHVVSLDTLKNRGGNIVLEIANRGGPWGGGTLPKNAEFYLTRPETRYGTALNRTFKVSNSLIMGDTKFPITQARDWTADELTKFAVAPIEPPAANSNPQLGETTALAGTANGEQFRQRFADQKPLLGVDWSESFWPVPGGRENCLGPLVPIYDRNYPDMGRKRTIAKPGYAVGAITAKTKTFVNGIQITFMKLTTDGKLDPSDSYTSEWLGPHEVGVKETKLTGNGREVIGLLCYQFGVLNALGLVLDTK